MKERPQDMGVSWYGFCSSDKGQLFEIPIDISTTFKPEVNGRDLKFWTGADLLEIHQVLKQIGNLWYIAEI